MNVSYVKNKGKVEHRQFFFLRERKEKDYKIDSKRKSVSSRWRRGSLRRVAGGVEYEESNPLDPRQKPGHIRYERRCRCNKSSS